MSESYCYDSQLSDITSQLYQISTQLEKLIDILDPSNKCSCCKLPFEKCWGKIIHEMESMKRINEEASRLSKENLKERQDRYER